jgi:predicted short-subunit dehydrogenase-like oxidoreductase (DUF2520 family)
MAQHRPAVAIVGAGAVAQALGRLLADSGERVVALASRTRSKAADAARFVGPSVRVASLAELPGLATRVLVAVSDEGIAPVAEALAAAGMRSGVVLHTCGARGPEALAPLGAAGVACGLLHPLQTIVTPEQGVRNLVDVTFGIAGDGPALEWATEIVTRLHGRSVHIEADRLSYYHAGAVMASNALVAVVDAALVLFARAGIERDPALGALGPLLRTSLDNVIGSGPQAALTGPIARGDAATVAVHLRALRDVDPTVAGLYEAAAERLLVLARARGVPATNLRAIERLIEAARTEAPDDRSY